MKRINLTIGKSADGIIEDVWANTAVKEINEISKECATELQQETGWKYPKPPRPAEGIAAYGLELSAAPPTRLLSLVISLAAWLGWILHKKNANETEIFLKMIEEAYRYGVSLSLKGDEL